MQHKSGFRKGDCDEVRNNRVGQVKKYFEKILTNPVSFQLYQLKYCDSFSFQHNNRLDLFCCLVGFLLASDCGKLQTEKV